ncbi:DNA (cytosine-5)-methyltransferase CMT2 [Gracilariopsis chorda]|uniref:DNA (Cytosine-5)-methyltransferase CMT2 n=1 Tax=Gracilariopsis chorda TaxID=448386 RepID=A0A2V3ITV0_9FLOR|nr:DNA (cytosine-5)-methyltransferase CMT2 [Gracilariopsis chorda]|eukprot:PXF44540.1 DNA (cytosine-5)-methyltransferase CMT2 [Gracilariopsis chorda]
MELAREEQMRVSVATRPSSSLTISDTPNYSLVGQSPEISRNTRTSVANRDTPEGEELNRTAVQERNTPAKTDSPNAQAREGVEDSEYVIACIVDKAFHEDGPKLQYRVRWCGYPPNVDAWYPIENLPRSHVVRYHRRKKLPLPANLVDALVGLFVDMLPLICGLYH